MAGSPVSTDVAERVDETGVPAALRAAGWLSIVLGLGFGIAMAISLRHLAREDELPMTPFGFRAFAGGPFQALPRPAFSVVGGALAATCAADVLAGAWLARGQRRGARLALVTTPFGLVFSVGFALPFLLIGIPLRAALIALARRELR